MFVINESLSGAALQHNISYVFGFQSISFAVVSEQVGIERVSVLLPEALEKSTSVGTVLYNLGYVAESISSSPDMRLFIAKCLHPISESYQ